jgi:hypothetical protein
MLIKGCNAGLVKGLCPNFIAGGVIRVQYAYGILIFLENDPSVPINMK